MSNTVIVAADPHDTMAPAPPWHCPQCGRRAIREPFAGDNWTCPLCEARKVSTPLRAVLYPMLSASEFITSDEAAAGIADAERQDVEETRRFMEEGIVPAA